jgi:plasmid stabilization system protein ParE
VYEFIARDSQKYAQLTVERIIETAGRLAQFPQLGQIIPEFPHLAYRQMTVGAYRLIYRDDSERDRILVMGVIHSSRDLAPLLESR